MNAVPDPFIVPPAGTLPPGAYLDNEKSDPLAEALAAEMGQRWHDGERPVAEEFLARHPRLWQQPEAAIDLIYEELLLRQQHGVETTAAAVLQRFPQWRAELEVLLRCHQLLEADLTTPTFPAVGETLGELRLLAVLGQGSRGRVYLATQPALADRPVVVKVTPRDSREHVTLARLQHTHIVPLYAAHDDADRGLRVLCMPYFGGATLAQLLEHLVGRPVSQRSGRSLLETLDQRRATDALPARAAGREYLARATYVQAVCWVGACLADALHYAHERGLAHLDVKPSNVLLAADGQPMLLDFHLARPPLTVGGLPPEWLGGTPAYMAPEQQRAVEAVRQGRPLPEAVDGRADVYALGLLLYEALGGTVPLLQGGPPRLERCSGLVSVGLADILGKAMSARAADRYASAADLGADLRRHLADQPLRGVANRSWAERWRKWRQRRPHALRLLAMLLAVLLAAGAVALLLGLSVAGRLGEARAYLERGRQLRAAGQLGVATETLRQGQLLAQDLPLGRELHRQLGDELRLTLDQRLHHSAFLLEDARRLRDRGQHGEAAAALRRGLAGLEGLADVETLTKSFHDQLRLTERAEAAAQLHALVDRLRFLYGEGSATASREWRSAAPQCASFWAKRVWLSRPADPDLPAAARQQIQDDLLDLAVLQADLGTRWAVDRAAAARAALAVLAEAETQLGASQALCGERQRQAETLGLREQAREAAKRAAELPPRTAWEYYALGRALLREGHLDEAAAAIHQAVRLQPQGLWPNFYEGVCAYQRGHYDDAVTAFSVCVALDPSGSRCLCNRGLALAKVGRADRALEDYDRALQLEPALAAAALNRGLLHLHAKRYQEASVDLERALRLGADSVLTHYSLAVAYRACGKRAAAVACLQRVLQHNPHHEEARRLLRQLGELR
jgi:tetratricopeptide (TPR) repeat protein